MTAADFELLDDDEATGVLVSRFRRLVAAGYECQHALVLAVYPQFDLDDAERLISGRPSQAAAALLVQRAA